MKVNLYFVTHLLKWKSVESQLCVYDPCGVYQIGLPINFKFDETL